MKFVSHIVLALMLAGPLGLAGSAVAQTPAPAESAKPDAAKPDAAKPDTAAPDAAKPADTAKKPTKAELGEMLKKCSDEADAKGLTVQKGKGEARKAYRRSCMLKNGVAPRKK